VTISGDFVIIIDYERNPLYKISFNNNIMQQFFFLSIRRFLEGTRKKKFNDATKIIEIPTYANNRKSNAEQIQNLMNALHTWHKKALENELKQCPIKALSLVEFERMKDLLEMEIDARIFTLLDLSEEDIRVIEQVRDP
jgi:hypothetical protein